MKFYFQVRRSVIKVVLGFHVDQFLICYNVFKDADEFFEGEKKFLVEYHSKYVSSILVKIECKRLGQTAG
jgi:hypothetical protein